MMKKPVLSEQEKYFQSQRVLEKELQRLISEYFVLDKAGSRSQFSRGSTLAKGDKVLSIFEKEHGNILLDLSRAAAPGRIRDDEKHFDELSNLLQEYDDYQEKVNILHVYMQEVEGEIKVVQKGVQDLRQQQITDWQYVERVWHAQKTLEALENKLETQMIQFGTICTKNRKLRELIHHFVLERGVFIHQWESLIEKLADGKKIMLDLIEQATIAYNQREEWCTKLQILRIKAHHDLNNNNHEMRELHRRCDDKLKLREYFWIKGQKRLMKDLEMKEQLKRHEVELKLKEKLEMYEHMLQDISTFSKQRNVKAIAKKFTTQEQLSLSKFKYVIESIRETEALNDRLGYLHIEIDENYAIHDKRMHQQQNLLGALEYDLEDYVLEAKEAEKQLDDVETHFKALLQGIDQLFKLCKCDKDPLLRLLGNNNTVQFYNVGLYLQVLERTLHHLLISAGYKDQKGRPNDKKVIVPEEGFVKILTIEKIVQASPCSLCVEHEMVSDVIDTLQHVWSKAETKSKLRMRLKLPGGKARLHTISHCQMTKARRLMQRRYE